MIKISILQLIKLKEINMVLLNKNQHIMMINILIIVILIQIIIITIQIVVMKISIILMKFQIQNIFKMGIKSLISLITINNKQKAINLTIGMVMVTIN